MIAETTRLKFQTKITIQQQDSFPIKVSANFNFPLILLRGVHDIRVHEKFNISLFGETLNSIQCDWKVLPNNVLHTVYRVPRHYGCQFTVRDFIQPGERLQQPVLS